MKQPFKHILTLLICIFSLPMIGQHVSEGTVIITEGELTSLINTILKHKNTVVKENDSLFIVDKSSIAKKDTIVTIFKNISVNEQAQTKLALKKEGNPSVSNVEVSKTTNTSPKAKQQITALKEEKNAPTTTSTVTNEELKKLSIEIQELKKQLTDYLASTKATNVKESGPSTIKEKQVVVTPPSITTQYRDSIILIRDTVYVTNNLINYIDTTSVNSKILATKILELQNRLAKKDSIIAVLNKQKNTTISSETNYIYFGNNIFQLTNNQIVTISKLVSTITENSNFKIQLKGFASNIGNENYNKILSLKRIESVKNSLLKQGIEAAKISTENIGIDYNAVNETDARRVEIEVRS